MPGAGLLPRREAHPDALRRCRYAALLLSSLLLAACASAPPPRPAPSPPAQASTPAWCAPAPTRAPPRQSTASADLAFRALGLVGTPYRSAGSDPSVGFDCSGFVVYVYRDALGMALPRSTGQQYALAAKSPGTRVLVTGDLVFFDTSGRGVSHVGIYVGEGRFVHAPNHGGRVRLDHLDDRYWKQRYLGARRVLR